MTGERPGRPLPGDLTDRQRIERIIRVDHAGEYGASRIYLGQLAVLGHTRSGGAIRRMKMQEDRHLEVFRDLVIERRVRPTALIPLWTVAGLALGAGTALLGQRAAMACTIAVEEVIGEHYANQARALGPDEDGLRRVIERFRDEELGHRDQAVAHGGEGAVGYPVMRRLIQKGSRLAIWLSERI